MVRLDIHTMPANIHMESGANEVLRMLLTLTGPKSKTCNDLDEICKIILSY